VTLLTGSHGVKRLRATATYAGFSVLNQKPTGFGTITNNADSLFEMALIHDVLSVYIPNPIDSA
jgi:hypothetical protein